MDLSAKNIKMKYRSIPESFKVQSCRLSNSQAISLQISIIIRSTAQVWLDLGFTVNCVKTVAFLHVMTYNFGGSLSEPGVSLFGVYELIWRRQVPLKYLFLFTKQNGNRGGIKPAPTGNWPRRPIILIIYYDYNHCSICISKQWEPLG